MCNLHIIGHSILKQINNLLFIFDFVSKDMCYKIRKIMNALNHYLQRIYKVSSRPSGKEIFAVIVYLQ